MSIVKRSANTLSFAKVFGKVENTTVQLNVVERDEIEEFEIDLSLSFECRSSFRLLMNVVPLHIFTIGENNRVDVADFVRLCDVTPVTLSEYLREIVHLANQFRKSKEFLRRDHRTCRTLASFAEIIQHEMMIIDYQLADIERSCVDQSLDEKKTLCLFIISNRF